MHGVIHAESSSELPVRPAHAATLHGLAHPAIEVDSRRVVALAVRAKLANIDGITLRRRPRLRDVERSRHLGFLRGVATGHPNRQDRADPLRTLMREKKGR